MEIEGGGERPVRNLSGSSGEGMARESVAGEIADRSRRSMFWSRMQHCIGPLALGLTLDHGKRRTSHSRLVMKEQEERWQWKRSTIARVASYPFKQHCGRCPCFSALSLR